MKLSCLYLGLLLLAGAQSSLAQSATPAPRLLLRINDQVAAQQRQAGQPVEQFPAFEQLNRAHQVLQVQALNPGQAEAAAGAPAVYMVELPAGTDARKALREYQQTNLFRYVELDGEGSGGGTTGITPNDPQYAIRQWSLSNTGSFPLSPARVGADIRMQDAWAISTGDSSITVATIDSGGKLSHPEFSRRIWRNRQEIPANGIDDDNNGYVDDVQGWNFVSNTNDPTDDYGHGTNVMGIIGATGNNGVGFAGVNWGCKLMVCKGINAQNSGFYSWWTSAIYYATNNGARVINMSLGGTSTSQTMQDAVTYAVQHGVVVVACMMNTNSSVPYYPAALTGVIAVGSTNPNDTRSSPFFWSASSGSNYGSHISLVAPGNYIYGLHYLFDTNYGSYWGGTSQATPHVAGVASLLLTLRPLLTPAQVKTILQSSADDGVGNPGEDVPGWDQYYGFGRLNAARALTAVVTGTSVPRSLSSTALRLYPNPARHQLMLQTTEAQLLNRPVRIFNTLGQLVQQHPRFTANLQLSLALPPGVYWVTVGSAGSRLLVE